ncbi:TonB-dependent receptor [Helicobacter bilis]|uniref:TonB-dependent receptor n=1 Tax=Helicobacter bilis TaxID=37372 RepID=A0A4U8U3E5_9HELI|nr:TonB-dependent receptor [Helicobacter bilis]TLE07827.1 TonB-dependent receptor [Helicobacter bilis]
MCNIPTQKGSKLILSAALLSISLSQSLCANEIATDDKLAALLDSKKSDTDTQTKRLNAVVTSSTGFDLPLKDEAKNIVLIDKEELQNKGFLNLNQALQYSPLITFNSNSSIFGNNIDLRGQGLDSNRAVKILVNRVPISLLDTSHGVSPYNNIDIENIERIEIIPGGGAVVYGNGTRGGVINIVTKMPSKDFNRVVLKAISGESVGLQGGSLSIASGKKLSENLFIKGDVSAGYTPGARNAAGVATDKSEIKAFSNDNETNLYTAFQALYNLSENQKFDFNISYSHSWQNIPLSYLSYTSSVRGSGGGMTTTTKDDSTIKKERNNPDEYTIKTQNDSLQTSLNYTTKWSENLDFDALAFYQFSLTRYMEYEYCISTKATGSFCPAGIMDMGKPSGFQNHAAGLNLKAKYTTTNNTLILGLDNILESSKRINHIDHFFPMNAGGVVVPPRPNVQQQIQMVHYITNITNTAIKLSNSLYVFDSFSFTDSIKLSGGVRLEYSNYWMQNIQDYWQKTKTNGNTTESSEYLNFKDHAQNLSYAAEITPSYQYSDTGSTYAKLELGFISPSAFQMINADPNSSINSSNNGSQLKRNESNGIKPEQYITAEIGMKDEFDFSYISATLFYTHTFNEIFVNNIKHGTAYTYSNLGQTQRVGAELSAQQSFFDTSWLRLSESIGMLYTNILQTNVANAHLQGNMVPYVPWLKATLNIESDILRTETLSLTLFFNNTYISQSLDSTSGTSSTAGKSHIMNKGGYVLSDLGAMFSIKDLKINVGVRNLFNSWYATYQKYPFYAPALGRNYYAELRYNF